MEKLNFSELLKQRRKELGITQLSLSKSVECSEFFIIKLEKNTRLPGKELTLKLSEELNLPFDELWSKVQEEKINQLESKHQSKKEGLVKGVKYIPDSSKSFLEAQNYLQKIFSGSNEEKKAKVLGILKTESENT